MKKILVAASMLATLAIATTSCGGGQTEVNNDSIVPQSLSDSINQYFGAFNGANLSVNPYDGLNTSEYLRGLQLAAGHEFTPSQLQGIKDGVELNMMISRLEAEGIAINRDIILQEFRKYAQRTDITPDEYTELYNALEECSKKHGAIIEKREEMRAQAQAKACDNGCGKTCDTPAQCPEATTAQCNTAN